MSDARTAILQAIASQLARDSSIQPGNTTAEAAYAAIPRTYTRQGALSEDEKLELFYDRLQDYDSDLVFTGEAGIADAVAEAMRAAGEAVLLVPPALPLHWIPAGVQTIRDEGASIAEIDRADCVLTGCAGAIAMSGTILLQHGTEQGRRAATLLPDHHICIVYRDQVVETIAEALPLLTGYRTAPMTTIAGPSATSDIEMTRIRGVHGPRRLTAIIVSR